MTALVWAGVSTASVTKSAIACLSSMFSLLSPKTPDTIPPATPGPPTSLARSCRGRSWRETIEESDRIMGLIDVTVGVANREIDEALATVLGTRVLVGGNHKFPISGTGVKDYGFEAVYPTLVCESDPPARVQGRVVQRAVGRGVAAGVRPAGSDVVPVAVSDGDWCVGEAYAGDEARGRQVEGAW